MNIYETSIWTIAYQRDSALLFIEQLMKEVDLLTDKPLENNEFINELIDINRKLRNELAILHSMYRELQYELSAQENLS